MKPDSALLKKAKEFSDEGFKALEKLISQYWHCFPGMGGEFLSVDWGRQALQTAEAFVHEFTEGDFETELSETLFRAFNTYKQHNRIRLKGQFYDKEIPTDTIKLLEGKKEYITGNNVEFNLDYEWIKEKVKGLMVDLTDLEREILEYDFWSGKPSKTYYEKAGISQQAYADTKKRALAKLRKKPGAEWVWLQAREIFGAKHKRF